MNKAVFEKIRSEILRSQNDKTQWNLAFYFLPEEYAAAMEMPPEIRDSEFAPGLMLKRKLLSFRFDYLPEEPLIGRLVPHPPVPEEELRKAEAYFNAPEPPWGKSDGQCGHCAPDYEFLFRNGIDGVRSIIQEKQRKNPAPAYRNFLTALDAFSAMIGNAADTAEKAGNAEVAGVCRKIGSRPPETFAEALQLMWFVLLGCQQGDRAYLVNPGRIDRTLFPYYRNIAREKALELIAHFYLLLNSACPRGLAYGVMVGGSTGENEISRLALEALRTTRLVYPGVGVCVNRETPDGLVRLAVDIAAEGLPNPAFFNDELIRKGLEYYGVPREDSDDYINSTCVEITPVGASNVYVASPYYNLCGTLLEAMETEHPTFEALVEAFKKRLSEKIVEGVAEQIRNRESRRKHMRRPLLSILTRSCIERGLDIEEGGADCNWVECSFVGLANLADSLTVIRSEVYGERNLTLSEMLELCRTDFRDRENLRMKFLNAYPKYGQNCAEADSPIPGIVAFLDSECAKHRVPPDNSRYIPGTFCWEMHQILGAQTCATPDGRRANFPFADGAGPAQGREKFGPTSAASSVCSWNHGHLIGGSAFNMKFPKNLLVPAEAREKLVSLIRTFLREGGFQTQINVADRETLLQADRNPDDWPDLLVRIGGYTDYFARLSEGMRKEVLMRMQYDNL